MIKFKTLLLAGAALLATATAASAQHGPPPASPHGPPPEPAPSQRTTTVEGVTVTGQRPDLRTNIDRRSYSVANDLQATTGSIADALRNVPSVEVDLEGNVSLRGDPNVTILIDGKPSGMFEGEGRGDALQQMSADQIDRVEVMTNPSAAYRPDGSGGIINLVTKTSRRPGASGSVRFNAGNDGRFNGGVGATWNSGKLGLSGDAAFRREHMEGGVRDRRSAFDIGLGQFIDSRQDTATEGQGDIISLRGGATYDPDAATRFSLDLRYRSIDFTGDGVEHYERDDAFGALASAYDRLSENGFERSNAELRAGYLRKFTGDEHQLSADLRLERTSFEMSSSAVTDALLPPVPLFFQDTSVSVDQDRASLQVAYTRPFTDGGRLRTGVEVERTEIEFDNFGANGPAANALTVDPALTNLFLYDQSVGSAYATLERPFGKLTAQAGLRLEQVQIDTDQVTSSIRNSNDYFRAYPTLHLGWELSETQQLSASYSVRVQRPQPQDLNPYVVYLDPFNRRSGNPFLEPERTQSFEAGWSLRDGATYYLATLYFRETTDAFTDVVQDLGGGVFLTTRDNLGRSRNAGLELVASGKLTPTLSYNVSGNIYWAEIDAANLGFAGSRSAASAGGRASLNWQVTPNDFIQVNGMIMGERLQAQGVREATGMLNLGYRRKLSDNLFLVFTAQDVLETFRDSVVIDTPTLQDQAVRRMHAGRSLYLGFTYNFGGRRQREPGFDFDGGQGPG